MCYKINCLSFWFAPRYPPPPNAGKNSSWVLICDGKCHSGGHVATQHEVTIMNHDKKWQVQNEKSLHTKPSALWRFQVYPSSIPEPWSAVAQNIEGSPPVLPEAIIKIKQNMFCNICLHKNLILRTELCIIY